MPRTLALIALLVLVLPGPAWADEEGPEWSMTVGSEAPPIDITHWIKGVEMDRRGSFTPVTDFEEGKVYVLEFWATWCGPCVGSMPHLTALQETYRDQGVTIIGISDESLPKATAFLFKTYPPDGKVQNDRIGYTLTTDPDQSVKKDYFLAAGQTGIPCAFIVGKQGLVEWIGHPSRMDDVLEAVVNDTWDREPYRVQFEKERTEKMLLREARGQIAAAVQAQDWDAAASVYDGLIERMPDALSPRYDKFLMLLTMAKRPDAAYALGGDLLGKAWDNAPMLNQVAWLVADDKRVEVRDLDFAMKAAVRATELTEAKDASILDTLARVYFEQGDLEAALEWQQKAVEHAGEGRMSDSIRKTLEQYEEALTEKAPGEPALAFHDPILIHADGAPIAAEAPGYACPAFADVNGDGLRDLVVGQMRKGQMQYFENIGTAEEPVFAKGDWIRTGDEVAFVPDIW